jgi:hypothetical protein
MGDIMSSKKETEEQKMIREAQALLAKLAPEVSTLEKKTGNLKTQFENAEQDGTIGKQRANFLKEAKIIQELGTKLLIKFDAVVLIPKDTVNRQVRKQQIKRIEGNESKLKLLGLIGN